MPAIHAHSGEVRQPQRNLAQPEKRGDGSFLPAGKCRVLRAGAYLCLLYTSTTGRTLLRLYEPTGGKIYYDGNLLFDKDNKIAVDMLPYRRRMQIVFQDPYASLDPRMTIGDIVGEGIDIHHLAENEKDRHDKICLLYTSAGDRCGFLPGEF